MKKKKLNKGLKIILIIIAILIILFLIHTIRNYIIVSQLQNKVTQYTNNNNYHIKFVDNHSDGMIVITNYYKKDNKHAYFLERNKDGELLKLSVYSDGTKTHRYIETPDNKTANFDKSQFLGVEIVNVLQNDNTWQNILASMMAQIKSVTYNEKSCYEINNFPSQHLLLGLGKNIVYIEKDTGLVVKNDADDSISEREYEFNNVEDSIFIEPDISQYQVYEK